YAGFGIDFCITAKRLTNERCPEAEFIWESPDGTKILTTKLGNEGRGQFFVTTVIPAKYNVKNDKDFRIEWGKSGMVYHKANAGEDNVDYFRFDESDEFYPETIKENVEECIRGTDNTVVPEVRFFPAGCDFSGSIEELDKIIEVANKEFPDYEFSHSTLEAYISELREKIDPDKLRTIEGELRDGPSSATSGNALSTRLYIKQANKKAQNLLIYKAEPLSAVASMLGGEYEKGFLDRSWEYLLKSHCHDSINGVTQDKTADDNIFRINQAIEIADAAADRSISEIIGNIDLGGYSDEDVLLVAFNPLPFPVSEILKVAVDMPENEDAWDFTVTDENGEQMKVQWISKESGIRIIHDLNSRPWPLHVDTHTVYMESGVIPAGGFKVYKVKTDRTFERSFICGPTYQRTTLGNEIAQANDILENDYLKVTVNSNGTFDLTDKENNKTYKNLHCFEDTGEVGDYWINLPPNNNRTYVTTASNACVWCENNGPLSATLGIKCKMELPKSGDRPGCFFGSGTKRSDETEILEITSYLTLKKGSKKLDVKVEIDNNIADHRLRVLYPTGLDADYSYAAGHFGVDKRPVMSKESGVEYWQDMQTLPQQTFVDVTDGKNGIAFVNDSLTEYELKKDGRGTLALTLLRSVKNRICTERRAINDFPEQNGGQCFGKQTATYSIYPHKGDWDEGSVYTEAQKFNNGVTVMQTAAHKKGGIKPGESFYSLSNDKLIMSAFKRAEDRKTLVFRFFNPTDKTQKTELSFLKDIKKAYILNLNEERQSEIPVNSGSISLSAEKSKIITVEVEF
ncbi:MAG: alpha-mannosidase, partial [Clostridia bacterium]|nr:alpha-mannosidase [Clostridia bacterium]